MKVTRKSIRRQSWKKKIALVVTALVLLGSTAYAHQIFVPGGWNILYVHRFTPTISQARGHDNARTNRRHYSWVKVGRSTGVSPVVSANRISYAQSVGRWYDKVNGWYVNL